MYNRFVHGVRPKYDYMLGMTRPLYKNCVYKTFCYDVGGGSSCAADVFTASGPKHATTHDRPSLVHLHEAQMVKVQGKSDPIICTAKRARARTQRFQGHYDPIDIICTA